MPAPPLLGSVAPGASPNSAAGGDSGAPDMNAQVGKVREAAQPFLEFLGTVPELSPYQDKFQKMVREILVKLASASKQQTGSSAQLPG
jgi:hypothetical protein